MDGDEVELQTTRPWHEHRCFGPFAFLDIAGQESQPPGSGSWVNQDEADFVLVLYKCLVGMYPSLKDGPHLAVISPYKQQVKLIRELFRDAIGVEATKLIDINTVDGFQVKSSLTLRFQASTWLFNLFGPMDLVSVRVLIGAIEFCEQSNIRTTGTFVLTDSIHISAGKGKRYCHIFMRACKSQRRNWVRV